MMKKISLFSKKRVACAPLFAVLVGVAILTDRFLAFIYNALAVPVATGVLYPFFGLLLSPIIAAAAMSISSASVVGNALRLNRMKL